MLDWGVHLYQGNLIINDSDLSHYLYGDMLFIDVETDEKDNLVGIGFTADGKRIDYTDHIDPTLTLFLETAQLVGQNLKFDAKLLVKWGVNIQPKNLFGDTILMSYVMNSTKESHGLKELGKERGYIWPSYKELVGKGKSKQTLDKQPIEVVANYNAMDVLVTYRLYEEFKKKMDSMQARILEQIELPVMRILFEMELKGVLVDEKRLQELNTEFTERLATLSSEIKRLAGKEINPNSNLQIANVLEARGFTLPSTPKGNKKVDKLTLEKFTGDEFVKILQEYNQIEKLVSTYTQGLLDRKSLPRLFPTYNQIARTQTGMDRGIATGRLSCSDPNLQQIPTKTEEGKKLRELFIPKEEYTLIDADYSQIEYRLLAHFAKEPLLIKAFMEGKDVHEETGKALGVGRATGKTLNFAAIYGAGNKRIAQTAKVTEEAAKEFLSEYWRTLPLVSSWINSVKYQARQKGGIYTLMKRWIPLPGLYSSDLGERWHWERCAVNFIIQGSAAEIMKLALLKVSEFGLHPILTVHDELLFEATPASYFGNGVQYDYDRIKQIMESVVKLDVPLIAELGIGDNWREAKGD